jgi:hypothetical protein
MKKTCKKCNIEQPIENFRRGAKMKDGYINNCKACDKIYQETNKLIIAEKKKEHYQQNREKVLKQTFERAEQKREELNKYAKEYYQTNKELLKPKKKEYYKNTKEQRNLKQKDRRNKDPLFKLQQNISGAIRKALNRKKFPKKNKTLVILGCTYEEFKTHLEKQFTYWMSWGNYGKYNGQLNFGWDIDHIIPLCTAKNEGELLMLNHYTNLQPLCSKVNRDIKRDKY